MWRRIYGFFLKKKKYSHSNQSACKFFRAHAYIFVHSRRKTIQQTKLSALADASTRNFTSNNFVYSLQLFIIKSDVEQNSEKKSHSYFLVHLNNFPLVCHSSTIIQYLMKCDVMAATTFILFPAASATRTNKQTCVNY